MDDRLADIQALINRGSLKQFHTSVDAKLAGTDYTVEQEDGTLRFYRIEKKGGFLGIGVKQQKDLVLEVKSTDGVCHVVEESADQDFADYLAKLLKRY